MLAPANFPFQKLNGFPMPYYELGGGHIGTEEGEAVLRIGLAINNAALYFFVGLGNTYAVRMEDVLGPVVNALSELLTPSAAVSAHDAAGFEPCPTPGEEFPRGDGFYVPAPDAALCGPFGEDLED